jgi:GTP-binding protein Era
MDIQIDNRSTWPDLDLAAARELALFDLEQEGQAAEVELSISFVDKPEIHALNLQWRGIDAPTDVLSFECDAQMLGDVVICPAVAAEHARDFDSTFKAEMALMLTHGILHLLGYDHIDDAEAEVMEARENELIGLWLSGQTATALDSSVPGEFRSGFVALCARPNAGKSTLTNAVVGEKVAIATDLAQTTRMNISGIKTTDAYQLILLDTPGLHKPKDNLGITLNRSAIAAVKDADAVAFLLDSTADFGRGDEWVLAQVAAAAKPTLLVLTKCALAKPAEVRAQREAALAAAQDLGLAFVEVLQVSALEGEGVAAFCRSASALLPDGPLWYPAEAKSGLDVRTMLAELLREQAIRQTRDEVPHAIGVEVADYEYDRKKDLNRIRALLYVERDSQKGLLIGKGGARLKAIGSAARLQMEQLLHGRVYLDVQVRVRKNWRRDLNQIRRFGYSD